jgi:hypothetical protein
MVLLAQFTAAKLSVTRSLAVSLVTVQALVTPPAV